MIATAAKRSPPVFDEAAFVNRLRAYEKSPAGFTDALLDLARQQESNPRFVPNARPYMDTMGLPTDEMVKHLTRRNIDILAADTDAQGALRLSAEKISLHRTRVIICIGWALETAGRLVRI